jgi:hypothetical protein
LLGWPAFNVLHWTSEKNLSHLNQNKEKNEIKSSPWILHFRLQRGFGFVHGVQF